MGFFFLFLLWSGLTFSVAPPDLKTVFPFIKLDDDFNRLNWEGGTITLVLFSATQPKLCSQIFFRVNDPVLYAVFDRGREQETLVLCDGVRKVGERPFQREAVLDSATVGSV